MLTYDLNKYLMSVIHSISYDILNKESLDFFLKVYLNDELKLEKNFRSKTYSDCSTFCHNYKSEVDTDYILRFEFDGVEQETKLLHIKQILINNQILDVNQGYYYPKQNQFWQSLDDRTKKEMIKKTVKHGANFGWFGTIEYEYSVLRNRIGKNKNNGLFPMPRIYI